MSSADGATEKTRLAHTVYVCQQTKLILIFLNNLCIQLLLSLSLVCTFIAENDPSFTTIARHLRAQIFLAFTLMINYMH